MVAPPETKRLLRRYLLWLVPLVAVLVVFPPVHIRADRADRAAAKGNLSPQQFAEMFWEQELPGSLSKAVDAVELLRAVEQDPTRAAKTFGRETGIGARPVYLVSGQATVARADDRGVWLDFGTKVSSDVLVLTGPIFGNQLRDVTGRVRIQDFSSFDFNAVSTELNHLVETRVQPELHRRATPGTRLTFVGAGELDDASSERTILRIVPIRVTYP